MYGSGASGFQFHNGTIKRLGAGGSVASQISFQFHNGTIKSIFAFILFPPFFISIPQWYD